MMLAVAVPPIGGVADRGRVHAGHVQDVEDGDQSEDVLEEDEEEQRHEVGQVPPRVLRTEHRREHLVTQRDDQGLDELPETSSGEVALVAVGFGPGRDRLRRHHHGDHEDEGDSHERDHVHGQDRDVADLEQHDVADVQGWVISGEKEHRYRHRLGPAFRPLASGSALPRPLH
jgi:hypothetical protein